MNEGKFLQNLMNTISGTVGNVVNGVVGGITSNVGSMTAQIVGAATPMIGTAVNSTAAQIAASGFSGAGASAAQIASANNGVGLSVSGQTIVNAEGKIVQLNKLTGMAKFFCYYKMDADGRIILEGGKPSMNWAKVGIHGAVVVTFGVALFKVGKKKRWF